MKNFKNKKVCYLTNQGSILAYALIIITIVSILLTASLKVVVGNMQFAINRESKEQSLQIAEAGVYFYKWYLTHKTTGLSRQEIREFWDSGNAYGTGDDPYESDFDGVGVYSIAVIPPNPDSTISIVTVTGWTYKNPNLKRTLRVRFRQPSWSEYVVICDSNIVFDPGTNVMGKVHANGGIRFDAVAHNVVSSSVATYDDPDHGGGNEFGVHTHIGTVDPLPPNAVPNRPDVFNAGREFPVPVKDFNGILADLADMKTIAGCTNIGNYCPGDANGATISANGIYFNNSGHGRHIVLRADGTMLVSIVTDMADKETKSESVPVVYTIPDDGVIFVEDSAWVEGTINDVRVSIVAADLSGGNSSDILIKKNINYTNYDGRDIIALMAQENVEVTKSSENNLKIDAVLLANSGKVGKSFNSSDHKNSVTLYGAIVTRQKYSFLYTDGAGYENRNLIFDNNLLYYPPPYFPTGTDYVIDSWEEL